MQDDAHPRQRPRAPPGAARHLTDAARSQIARDGFDPFPIALDGMVADAQRLGGDVELGVGERESEDRLPKAASDGGPPTRAPHPDRPPTVGMLTTLTRVPELR